MGVLPGRTVPPELTDSVLGAWLTAGFHLRIDETFVYLCYGHEDIVAVLPRREGAKLRSGTLCALIRDDLRQRFAKGDALRTAVNRDDDARYVAAHPSPDAGDAGRAAPIRAKLLGSKEGSHLKFIPPSLVRCDACGDYRGTAKWKELDHPARSSGTDPEEIVTFSCLCQGIVCPRCKKNRIYRPISNAYDPATNQFWHMPWLIAIGGCGDFTEDRRLVSAHGDLILVCPLCQQENRTPWSRRREATCGRCGRQL